MRLPFLALVAGVALGLGVRPARGAATTAAAEPTALFRELDAELWEDLTEAGTDPALTAALFIEPDLPPAAAGATTFAASATVSEPSTTTPR